MKDRRYILVRTDRGFDLERDDRPSPSPGAGEVLVRVRAISLNRRDAMIRDLSYPAGNGGRFVPLSDAAGDVVAVGPDVAGFAVGDRVTSTFLPDWQSGRLEPAALASALGAGGRGVASDYVVLPANGVAPLPPGWSYEEGACLPCAATTAWNALVTLGQLQELDWVLVIGTGGVALFALQIAVAAGARVVVLSSSTAKRERAKSLGARVTLDYVADPEWHVAVRAATGGVRHAVELGGAGTIARTLKCMAFGGHVALIGALDGFGGEISGVDLALSGLRLSAVVAGSASEHRAAAAFLAQHDSRPVIDSTFPFAHLDEAYARLVAGAFGKVVVTLD